MSEAKTAAGGQPADAADIEEAPREIPDRFFVGHVIAQASVAVIRNHLGAAGFNVDTTGKLIAKPGNCEQCGRYSRLHSALNEDRFLCSLCWSEDLCST